MNPAAKPLEKPVIVITSNAELTTFCARMASETFVTVDTEFLRETTYYPKLCLIQVAGRDEAVLIDPLAEGLDLGPFFALMADEKVLKVFHAAKQDFEIMLLLSGALPHPVFDTQIAAMVAGFGDQVGYEAIVRKLVGASIDKSSQFTDWSRRPLTNKQSLYALSDVVHLRVRRVPSDRFGDERGHVDRAAQTSGRAGGHPGKLHDPLDHVGQPSAFGAKKRSVLLNLSFALHHPVCEVLARGADNGKRRPQFVRDRRHEFHLLTRERVLALGGRDDEEDAPREETEDAKAECKIPPSRAGDQRIE